MYDEFGILNYANKYQYLILDTGKNKIFSIFLELKNMLKKSNNCYKAIFTKTNIDYNLKKKL
jgi:hypothetical protein